MFVNHSWQIVLDRQILRLCNKFSKSSFRIRLNSQIYSIRKASSNGFAYVWGGLKPYHNWNVFIKRTNKLFGRTARYSVRCIWAVAWDNVRPAKPQISLRIRAVWSEPLLVAWIFYDCSATDWTSFGVSKFNRTLHRLIWVYTCQNATLLEVTCRGSNFILAVSDCIRN